MMDEKHECHEEAVGVLKAMGIPASPAMVEQAAVLTEAMRIYYLRHKERGDLWERRGIRGAVFHVDNKTLRLMSMYWEATEEEIKQRCLGGEVDDALDLINYTCFLIRSINAGNITGSGR